MGETEENPVDQIVETLVYGPVGLALEAIDNWPKHVERGRSQVTLGRFLARTAAKRGGSTVETVADRLVNDLAQVVVDLFGIDLTPDTEADAGSAPAKPAAPVELIPFPIEAYDDLTVKQVRSALGDLDDAQLRVVRAREADGKARVTLIRHIDSILGDS